MGSVPNGRKPQRSYKVIAGALPSVTVSVMSRISERARRGKCGVNQLSTRAKPAVGLVHEHADEARLVPRLGFSRELDRYRSYEPAFV